MDKGKEKIASFLLIVIAWTIALALAYTVIIKLRLPCR